MSESWNGEKYYNSKIYRMDSKLMEYSYECMDKIVDLFKNLDNSKHYILDLGGGNGSKGKYICDKINAKGSICYDISASMMYDQPNNDNFTFVEERMENSFLNEKDKTFRAILMCESIHYVDDESFYEKLENFVISNLEGRLFLFGRCNPSQYSNQLLIPQKSFDMWESQKLNVLNCYKYFKNKNENREYKYKLEITKTLIDIEFTIPEYKHFICGKVWGIFNCYTEEELLKEFEKLVIGKKEDDCIILHDEIYKIDLDYNTNCDS